MKSMYEMKGDNSYSNMRDMLRVCLNGVQKRTAGSCQSVITSGLSPLDDLIDGFEKEKVYVIGARPAMGRMTFMLSMIRNLTLQEKVPVLLFSTNHMKSEYIIRLLSIHCGILTSHLHKGLMEAEEWERLNERTHTLIDAPLFVHDSMDLPLVELVETVRCCIRDNGIRIIFVDWLHMIDFAKEDVPPSDRVAKAMCALKQLACETKLPVVVGAMLNRGVEYREGLEGKRPQLSDLANSSFIEDLADVVMMVHRPDYYGIYQDEKGRDLRGRMEIYVRKNVFKPLGSIFLDYHQDIGIVCVGENTSKDRLNTFDLKDLSSGNETVSKLIKTFDIKEELPF